MLAFALELYIRYLNGETAEQLAAATGIPLERIEQRLRAAAAYVGPRVEVGRKTNSASAGAAPTA